MTDWHSIVTLILRYKSWTQHKLAVHLGVADSTLGGWMHGGYEPRYSHGAELINLHRQAQYQEVSELARLKKGVDATGKEG